MLFARDKSNYRAMLNEVLKNKSHLKKIVVTFGVALVIGVAFLLIARPPLIQILPEWVIIQLARQASEFEAIEVPDDIKVQRDVIYARTDTGDLTLDIYTPKSRSEEKIPVIVYVFGGGWFSGNKHQIQRLGGHLLTRHGYAVIATTYRHSDSAKFPAQIHDLKGTMRWIRAKAIDYNFNADAIGVWGPSAGGHLAALLATTNGNPELEGEIGGVELSHYSSDVQAVVDLFGVANLVKQTKPRDWMTERLLGGPQAERTALARLASPHFHASSSSTPILIFHGDKDELVPVEQSINFHRHLQEVGADSTLHIIEGGTHGGEAFNTPVIRNLMIEFFDAHLKFN